MYCKSLLLLPLASFLFPLTNFAQPINLGTVSNFVVFTTTGAISNSGTSFLTRLTGDVGTNSGAVTISGNTNGIVHAVPDGATLTAAADLLLAYGQLAGAIQTGAHAPLLGNGETINGGVYSIAGNTVLDNGLILDAQGHPDTVFIFQISGTLSTTSNSTVTLINGAKACNVFWKVEGLVSLGSTSIMRGNMVANNAAIDMAAGTILEGRAISTTGAITMNTTTANAPVGCGSPVHNGPAAPDFGSAACYAILSANGAVANGGSTFVTGDVGTNGGGTAGYEALKVTGMIHPGPDVSTAAAAADLLNAYNYLNTLPTDIQLLYPAQFGHNLVLTPHTYLLGAATTLTDTVFLNGEGNPDAVFVIKSIGALSTGALSNVVLTNGTQALNVYWMVEGLVSLNTGTIFNGTVVTNNAAVTLSSGTTVAGRIFSTTGAISTNDNVIAIPSGGCISLPLTWLSFTGTAQNNAVLLEWATTNEISNGHFNLERSSDGKTFEGIATINAAQDGNNHHQYSFPDLTAGAANYYRISQTDLNGKQSYYRTIHVSSNFRSETNHYVSGEQIILSTVTATPGVGSVQLYQVDGRRVSSQSFSLSAGANRITIAKPEVKGLYLIVLEGNGVRLYSGKVVVE